MAHRYNYLKFKMLRGMMEEQGRPITASKLAERIGVSAISVQTAFSKWRTKGIPYARRSVKTRHPRVVYQYKITQSGIKAYIDFKNRIEHHLTLNRLKKIPTFLKGSEN